MTREQFVKECEELGLTMQDIDGDYPSVEFASHYIFFWRSAGDIIVWPQGMAFKNLRATSVADAVVLAASEYSIHLMDPIKAASLISNRQRESEGPRGSLG